MQGVITTTIATATTGFVLNCIVRWEESKKNSNSSFVFKFAENALKANIWTKLQIKPFSNEYEKIRSNITEVLVQVKIFTSDTYIILPFLLRQFESNNTWVNKYIRCN